MDLFVDTSLVLAVTLVFLLLVVVWKSLSQQSSLPPGPPPLPFLGNLLHLRSKDFSQSFLKLSEKYGPVYTIYLGTQPVVVLCDYEAIKEALVDQADDFSGRGVFAAMQLIQKGYGVIISNGEQWKQLRRFSLTTLRNFGMGKRSIEERIQEEANFLVEELRKMKEMPLDPTFFFSKAMSNVICSVVFAERFDYEDKRFLTLLKCFNENAKFLGSSWAMFLNFAPNVAKHLPGPFSKFLQNIKTVKRFIKEYVKEHQETLDHNNPRDFIDCFLIKMHQEAQNPMSQFSKKNLVATTFDLFSAGTESVGATIRYGLLILMKYPHIEEKIQQEIMHVIGRNRSPCMEDRSKMPYTNAVTQEIQRFIDIVPMGAPHSVIRDTKFRGYSIPKGTVIFTVLTAALFDHKKFENPESFDPKHFLDENNGLKKNDAAITFSAGKRLCPGEGLARMELFLFFTAILQNFKLKPVVKPEEIDITPLASGIAKIARTYLLHLIPR